MNERKEDLKRSNPYRVPDAYFSDLRSTLRERIAVDQRDAVADAAGWGTSIRSMAGFAAAFGCMVLFAVVGYYFTGFKAQQNEEYMAQEATVDMLLGYDICYEDIEGLVAYETTIDEDENALFAQEVTDYLDTYGYGSVDVLEVIDFEQDLN